MPAGTYLYISIQYRGGLTLEHVAKQPADLVNSFFYRVQGGMPPRLLPAITSMRRRRQALQ
jgi:hypothetical protein